MAQNKKIPDLTPGISLQDLKIHRRSGGTLY